jgi:hypothetical protein
MCPAAPSWDLTYEQAMKTPKAYRHWVRRVETWVFRAQHYKPKSELALDLLDAVKGDAAAELENLPLEQVATDDGIELVVRQLSGFDEQHVLHVGRIMETYDSVKRAPNEVLSRYIARFRAAEREMKTAGLRIYDDESRAHKFLKGAMLRKEDQRYVLTNANYKYKFERIREAMVLLWPHDAPQHA